MRPVHHTVRRQQQLAVESLSGAQDEDFFEVQLLRAISLVLAAVGFDSVKPTALEAFRAEIEECRLLLSRLIAITAQHEFQIFFTSSP